MTDNEKVVIKYLNETIAYIIAEYGKSFRYELKLGKTISEDYGQVWYLMVIDPDDETRFLSYLPEDINRWGIEWLMDDIRTSDKWSATFPIF